MSDIKWSNVVGEKTIENGGYVGELLSVARLHVEDSLKKGELTQAEVGKIYTQMIASAFQQGIQFELTEKLREQEIATQIEAALAAKTKNELAYFELHEIKPTELEMMQEKMDQESEIAYEKILSLREDREIAKAKLEIEEQRLQLDKEISDEKVLSLAEEREIAIERLTIEKDKLILEQSLAAEKILSLQNERDIANARLVLAQEELKLSKIPSGRA